MTQRLMTINRPTFRNKLELKHQNHQISCYQHPHHSRSGEAYCILMSVKQRKGNTENSNSSEERSNIRR